MQIALCHQTNSIVPLRQKFRILHLPQMRLLQIGEVGGGEENAILFNVNQLIDDDD